MVFDPQEQEQLASLQQWWKKYGNLTSGVVMVGVLAFAGYSGWNFYQARQASQAAVLFEALQAQISAHDLAKVQRISADIRTQYGRTAYAGMAGLAAAKVQFDANDLNAAKDELQWVVDKANSENYRALAKIRLAGILLDQKSYDQALGMLDGKIPAEYAGLVADRRGDILIAQNKIDEARTAYKEALDLSADTDPGYQLIQLKLDALGGVAKTAKPDNAPA